MLTVRPLLASELDWANERYGEIYFLPSQPRDFIVVAEIDSVKAGLGRLVPVDETSGELGGIYVLPEFRGRQIAGAIVACLLQHSPYRQLFCIPFSHLEGFYRGFGFQPVSARSAVPGVVAEKLNWCTQEYAAAVNLLVRMTA